MGPWVVTVNKSSWCERSTPPPYFSAPAPISEPLDVMSRRRWDEDDRSASPVYRGSRHYEGAGASISEALSDAVVSVTTGAATIADKIGREARRNETLRSMGEAVTDVGDMLKHTTSDLGERVGHEWNKATSKITGDDRQPDASAADDKRNRRMLGNMPPGCFCDMRGYACPLHRGREAWRTSADYQLHVAHNVNPENAGQKATGIAGEGTIPMPEKARMTPPHSVRSPAPGIDRRCTARARLASQPSSP